MANKRIVDYTELAETPATGDLIEIVDVSDTTDDATGSSKKVTYANFTPEASETVKGKVELATTAEATTGTDTVRAVTPAGVKAVADTKANTSHTHAASDVNSGVLANARIATGTPDGTKFLRDDQVWTAIPGGGDALTANPLSQFAATTSAQLSGVLSDETGTGAAVFANSPALVTPTGIVKGDVGLGNVDNTSDAAKPVSTAAQTALDLKANDADVVHDTGDETVAGVKTFSSDPIIPDEIYDATAWNGSLEPPTKNAVRDKFESLSVGGDASTNTSTSVDNEIALFSGTGGKTLKRASTTGILKGTSGVISAATAGTDYYNPGGTDVAIADGGTGQSTATAAFDALAPTTTEGDLIYHNGTDNVRLAKGTASQVLTMNAGATAPEWAAAGGGGAVTPRNEITLVDYSNPLGDATPEGMATTNTTGSSTVTFSSTLGLVLTTGTADPSASLASVGSGSTTTWRSSIFDHNPSFKCTYSQDMDGAATRYFIGIGSSGSLNFAESGKMIGIRMNQSGGVTTYYAVSNNGTTETATNITTAFTGSTGYGLGTVGAVYDIYVVKNSTTDIKYYVNGALAATLTTNLPSGVVTTSSRYLCAYMMLNGGGTANTLNIRRLVAEYDLY